LSRFEDGRAEQAEGSAVVMAQSELAYGFADDPIAAPLVAEQVAPTSGALFAASEQADCN
jgi:hypothetical protein